MNIWKLLQPGYKKCYILEVRTAIGYAYAPLIAMELQKDMKVWNLAAILIQYCNMISFNFLLE